MMESFLENTATRF